MKINILSLVAILVVILFTIEFCNPKDKNSTIYTAQTNAFVGDQACKGCHANQYKDWLHSDHYKSIQKVSDSSVLGNFNNTTFNADGVVSHFFKRDGKYIINTQGEDGKNHDYEIVYAFGYYPLQQYLVQFPDGKLQATRLSWDSKNNKWFHQYAGQKIDYHDWLHWTNNAQNWNTMCAECHSTNLKKGYDIEKDSYNTTFNVLNVSCEACHGAGKNHIDYINSDDYKAGKKVKYSLLQFGANAEQTAQLNTCAPCHAVQSNVDSDKIVSNELLDNYIPQIPDNERFQADGQVKEEDYTYASFLQSKMYERGVKCSNCHNPHSGKLVLTGNQVCLQCHNKTFDSPAHHFHKENTEASECKNCHAPGKYYMGNDYRYDHSFRVPRPDLSVQYATTNACNNCHKDKTAKWASEAVVKWYGPKRKYHFAEDLIPGSLLNDKSEAHLVKLLNDTAVPAIIKATSIHYLGNIATQTSVNTILSYLNNNDAQIRYQSLKSLLNQASSIPDKNLIANMLTDKVRSVRIAAAELMGSIGTDQLTEQQNAAYNNAKAELEKHLLHNADFAHGNIAIADHYAHNNDFTNAEKFYLRALKKDSLANLARLNLAIAYSTQGKNKEAVKTLQNAIHTDPKNGQAWYNIALLYSEMKENKNAFTAFDKAVDLKSKDTRLYYNYGLLLQQSGSFNKAVNIILKGLQINPNDESLNYAMTYIYLENKQTAKAIPYATTLKKIATNNPDYQKLFEAIGLK